MYIKIKYIKNFLLFAACFFLAGFNYFTYVNAENSDANKNICNKSIDSDCDSLTDAEEKLYGTDLNSADTDKDGYSDGVEIKSGYDPLKAAPGDKIETGTKIAAPSSQSVSDTKAPTLTDNYLQELTDYLSSKEGQSVSTNDINNFIDEHFAEKIEADINIDNLSDADLSRIKTIKQDYSMLSDADRKEKEARDAAEYFQKMIYLLVSNIPTQFLKTSSLSPFIESFYSHFYNIPNLSKEDLEYFSDLANRLDTYVNQALDIPVPEKMLDLHIKFLRILKGTSTLQNSYTNSSDPIGQMVFSKQIISYIELVDNFFQDDFQDYFNSLSSQ